MHFTQSGEMWVLKGFVVVVTSFDVMLQDLGDF
jgi:hypothetical protein